MSFRLPNGMRVQHFHVGETMALYREIFDESIYTRGHPPPPDGVVVDVGANIGLFTLLALATCPAGVVHAFEPSPATFEKLRANVGNSERARLNAYGLHCEEGARDFTFLPQCTAFSGYDHDRVVTRLADVVRGHWATRASRRGGDRFRDLDLASFCKAERITTPVRRLSGYLSEAAIDRVDLLKIDVEGRERDVLAGIDPPHWLLIRRLAIEAHDCQEAEAIVSMLGSLSFTVEVVPKADGTRMIHARRPT